MKAPKNMLSPRCRLARGLGPVLALAMMIATAGAQDKFQARIPGALAMRLDATKKLRDEGNPAGARADLEKIVQEKPDYFRAQYNLGLLLLGDDDSSEATAEAISALEQARAIREKENIEEYSIYNTLAWAYDRGGRADMARAAYELAITHESKNTPDTNRRLFTNAGLFYFARGDLDAANKNLAKAVQYGSKTAEGFLETNQKVLGQMRLKDGFSYEARLSDRDKANSKGVSLIEAAARDGDEAVLREILLQDRANYYTRNIRDAEDTDSPGLEEPKFNRYHLISRKLSLAPGLEMTEVKSTPVVVTVSISKDAVIVSRKQ